MSKDTLLKLIIGELHEALENYEGITLYVDELNYHLLEAYHVDGTVEYNRHATAEKFLKYRDEYAAAWELLVNEGFAELSMNPFSYPEKYDVLLYDAVASNVLWGLPTIRKYSETSDKYTLTPELVKQLQEELEEYQHNYVWQT